MPGGLYIILTVNRFTFQELINLSLTCKHINKGIFQNQLLLVSLIKRGILVEVDCKRIFGGLLGYRSYFHTYHWIKFKFTKKHKNCKELMTQFYERLFTKIKKTIYEHKKKL